MAKTTYHNHPSTDPAHAGFVNKGTLANMMGVSVSAVNAYISEGMPCAVPSVGGKQSLYDPVEANKWLDQRLSGGDASMNELKKRKLQIDIDLAEITLSKERGELVEVEEVAKQIADAFTRVRGKLLALPTKTSGLVLGLPTQRDTQEVLDNAIREALDELVCEFTTDFGESPDAETTAES